MWQSITFKVLGMCGMDFLTLVQFRFRFWKKPRFRFDFGSVLWKQRFGSVLKQMRYNLSIYLLSTTYTVWQCMLYASLFVICYIRSLTLSLCFSRCSGWVLHIAVQRKKIMPHHVEHVPRALFFTPRTSEVQNCTGVTRIWKYCLYLEF